MIEFQLYLRIDHPSKLLTKITLLTLLFISGTPVPDSSAYISYVVVHQ